MGPLKADWLVLPTADCSERRLVGLLTANLGVPLAALTAGYLVRMLAAVWDVRWAGLLA